MRLHSIFEQGYETIVFFDCETTGFDSVEAGDQIIELAAVTLSKNGEERQMDEFVSLTGRFELSGLPQKIIDLTGITNDQLFKEGKPIDSVFSEFIGLFNGKTLLVAYNAQFDLIFVAKHLIDARGEKPEWLRSFNRADYLDPYSIYKDRHISFKSHKLKDAIDYYNLGDKVKNTHRAIDDAIALREVTVALNAENDDIPFYVNRFGWTKQPPKQKLKKVSYYDLTQWHNLPNLRLYQRETL